MLKKYGRVYATDINKEVLKLIPKDYYYEKKFCDAEKISYPSNYFDIVILFDVLEHTEKDDKVIKEVCRVLKKKGTLLLTVPAHPVIYSSHDSALEHKRRYTRDGLYDVLTKNFRIEKFGYWNMFLSPLIILFRLLKPDNKKPDDMSIFPKFLDKVFYLILSFENKLISLGFLLPFGLTLYAKCRK